jgi:hypothetical protein
MARRNSFKPVLVPLIIIGSVGLITTFATFAALQSAPAVLSANTIETTSADLRIDKDGTTQTTSITGFDFSGVTPGSSASPAAGDAFYLKNMGTANLAIKASISTTPTITTTSPNGATVDLTKVFFEITRVDTGAKTTLSLKSLMDGNTTGGVSLNDTVNALATVQYQIRVSMASDAFTAASASISGINLVFTGSAV